MRTRWLVAVVACGVALASVSGHAQRRWFSGPVEVPIDKAPAYDGHFTFARLKFTTGPGGYYYRGLPAWAHGYVSDTGGRAEVHLSKIINAVTNMNPHVDGTAVVEVGDPALFDYPVTYAAEPGYMVLDDKEAKNLGDYLRKGGFVIWDDFRTPYDWENFRACMQRVVPGEVPMELQLSHPIFHSFFEIPTLEFHQAYDRGKPYFFGMFENNDPSKPLQMIINFNNDVSQYWEYSDAGFLPIDLSNEAYKLGVNYVVYAMTH